MKLLVKNDQGDFFEYTCTEFEGYDVFTEANYHWGLHGWETYSIYDGDIVLMNVINPNVLDTTIHTLQ